MHKVLIRDGGSHELRIIGSIRVLNGDLTIGSRGWGRRIINDTVTRYNRGAASFGTVLGTFTAAILALAFGNSGGLVGTTVTRNRPGRSNGWVRSILASGGC